MFSINSQNPQQFQQTHGEFSRPTPQLVNILQNHGQFYQTRGEFYQTRDEFSLTQTSKEPATQNPPLRTPRYMSCDAVCKTRGEPFQNPGRVLTRGEFSQLVGPQDSPNNAFANSWRVLASSAKPETGVNIFCALVAELAASPLKPVSVKEKHLAHGGSPRLAHVRLTSIRFPSSLKLVTRS